MTISLPKLESILGNLPRLTIALVGDLFLDRYLELIPGVRELSLETGLEAYQIGSIRNSPGALGTVINNLAALGVGQLRPVTVLGDDGHAYDLRRAMASLPLDLSSVILDADRLTPTYTKPLRPNAAGHVGGTQPAGCSHASATLRRHDRSAVPGDPRGVRRV